jgi:hypothetical protein
MMARTASTFKQSDVAKALKAAKLAGIKIARFEIDRDGKIVVQAGKPDAGEAVDTDANDFGN